jgi:hypothetical protein
VSGGNGFSEPGANNVIPLMSPDRVTPLAERDRMMREAVAEVVTNLVIRKVAPEERSPYFDAAQDLLDRAGRSLDELIEASEPGPQQEALFRELGLR